MDLAVAAAPRTTVLLDLAAAAQVGLAAAAVLVEATLVARLAVLAVPQLYLYTLK